MAEAYISRRESPVKVGIIQTRHMNEPGGKLYSLTIPDLIGEKNAVIYKCGFWGGTNFVESSADTIMDYVVIEDGLVMTVGGETHSYITFDATTGTVTINNRQYVVFNRQHYYKYIIY